jgi:hypothetical protein
MSEKSLRCGKCANSANRIALSRSAGGSPALNAAGVQKPPSHVITDVKDTPLRDVCGRAGRAPSKKRMKR